MGIKIGAVSYGAVQRRRMCANMQVENVKVADLSPRSKHVNLKVKVLDKGETREIATMGGSKKLREILVGDETGTILMTLWGDQGEGIEEGDVLNIENGYITLYRGSMRLSVGRYGNLNILVDEEFPEVNTENNMSDKQYEMPRRRRSFRRRY